MKNMVMFAAAVAAIGLPVGYLGFSSGAEPAASADWKITDNQLQAMDRDFPMMVPAGSVDRIFASR